MNLDSLKYLQEIIDQDLTILENSNLAQANPSKYEEFKQRYHDLSKKIIGYLQIYESDNLTLNPKESLSLKT